jgi:hypothetical protein
MVTLRSFAVVVLVVNLVFLRASLLESQGTYKMQVLSPLNGLRVQTDTAGGQVGSFGGLGEFDVDAPGIIGGRLAVKENGRVGIGVPNPNQTLSVAGVIESTLGGFRFPDGTVQSHAGDVYTNYVETIPPTPLVGGSILHLTVPAGTYFVESWASLFNGNNDPVSNNNREAFCVNASEFSADRVDQDFGALAHAELALHTILTTSAGGLDLLCGVQGFPTNTGVSAQRARFTAMRIGGVVH